MSQTNQEAQAIPVNITADQDRSLSTLTTTGTGIGKTLPEYKNQVCGPPETMVKTPPSDDGPIVHVVRNVSTILVDGEPMPDDDVESNGRQRFDPSQDTANANPSTNKNQKTRKTNTLRLAVVLAVVVVAIAIVVAGVWIGISNRSNEEVSQTVSPVITTAAPTIEDKADCSVVRSIPWLPFKTTEELYKAVDLYLNETTRKQTLVYGPSMNHWDVSRLTNFDWAFAPSRPLDFLGSLVPRNVTEDLHCWDTSNATSMVGMFAYAKGFNGDISTWNVSQVTDMSYMFWFAHSFNQDLSQWDVGHVSSFYWTFLNAKNFSQDLSKWDVGSATTMASMFKGASSFNSNISSWNVSLVTDAGTMFSAAASFNHSLCSWLAKLPQGANLVNIFGASDQLGAPAVSCPETADPVLPFGPMCYPCV